jgi:hypothetical protein
MATATLVIGIGGTGQWVVTHVKKDLLELYNGIPKGVRLLAFDTETTSAVRVGARGEARRPGQRTTGPVGLDLTEYVYVGGNVYQYAEAIEKDLERNEDEQKYPHVSSWFQAAWFLGLPGAQATLNLTDGASAYRQLGRLAVFYNLTQATRATIRTSLTRAIEGIRNEVSPSNLVVCVAGSLAGGTGAGMFADIAHLIRMIARDKGIGFTMRGYLVLPQAFDATIQASDLERIAVRARSFAAMRENRRFAADFQYAQGYPMFYDQEKGDVLLRGYVESTLFDLLYYFDGRREENSLHPVELKDGVAPTIAEAIGAMIDEKSGKLLTTHHVNVSSRRTALIAQGELPPAASTVGSIGTYTILFPIYHIVEAWTHDLARTTLELFLQPKGDPDERTSALGELSDNMAGGRISLTSEKAAERFWSQTDVGGVKSGSLQRDLGRSGIQWEAGDTSGQLEVNRLQARSLEEWLRLLEPEPGEEEEVRQEVEKVLEPFLYPQKIKEGARLRVIGGKRKQAVVSTTGTVGSKEEKDHPKLGADRVEEEVEQFLTAQLGELDEKGERSGGDLQDALQKYADWHVKRFQLTLEAFVRDTLNGTASDDPSHAIENKAGKLGHLHKALDTMAKHLDGARQAIEQARSTKQRSAGRAAIEDRRDKERQAMRRNWKRQEDYLRACQELLELDRWDIAARVAAEAAKEMHDYVVRLRKGTTEWMKTLATDSRGLFAAILNGRKRVESDRNALRDLAKVRAVVGVLVNEKDEEERKDYNYAKEYEARRYSAYTSRGAGAVAEVLSSMRWEFEAAEWFDHEKQETHPYLKLSLRIRGVQDGGDVALTPAPIEENVVRFLERCRRVFDDAWKSESITAYLLARYPGDSHEREPERLAERLLKVSEPLLKVTGDAKPQPANFLRVYFDPNEPKQREFLDRVLNKLSSDSQASGKFVELLESEDRFRLTFIYHHELIDVEEVDAYRECQTAYEQFAGVSNIRGAQSRQIMHVFPAEINAAKYEERLGELLPHQVVVQLENPKRFRLFMYCWAYGSAAGDGRLIHLHGLEDNRTVWRLTLPPEEGELDPFGRPKKAEHYYLTDPDKARDGRPPSLLSAMETFTLSGEDRWSVPGEQRAIPYKVISKKLERFKAEDFQQRRKTLGQRAQEFKPNLANLSEAGLAEVAQYEKLMDLADTLQERVMPVLRDQISDGIAGADLDLKLAKVFELMIEEEMRRLRATINARISGAGRAPGTSEMAEQEKKQKGSAWAI